jgi:hypothetical protein
MQRSVLRRVVLLGSPLALALLEIFHPERPTSAGEAVEQGAWFMWFHFIQVPLIGLMTLAVYLLHRRPRGRGSERESLGHGRLRCVLQRLRRGGRHRHGIRLKQR